MGEGRAANGMWGIKHRELMLKMAKQSARIAKLKMVLILAGPAGDGANDHSYLVPGDSLRVNERQIFQ